MHRVIGQTLAAGLAALASVMVALPARAQEPAADEYTAKIKPIFERRCIACHSCYNAPCQLNLQSHAGAARGGTARNIYEASRLHSVPPTRLDIDATTPAGWRDKGFHDVLGTGQAGSSLLLRLTQLRARHPSLQPAKQVAESKTCLADPKDERVGDRESWATLAMPYGLPPLSAGEIGALKAWIDHGAPPPASASRPERESIPEALLGEVRAWEQFFNAPDARQRLVSRYMYEHLFLASLHFDGGASKTPRFFRLVRSRKACDEGVDEIATRRPTDPPGTSSMYYCLRPVTKAIVEKTHIPYELSARKLERIRSVFFGSDWSFTQDHAYGEEHARNPFATFAAIPVKARYQFLLDDAGFFVATFIKGPVCNGTEAVNSIQEHFFVFFLKPDADSMVALPEHARAAESRLVLPGAWGSDVTVLQDVQFLKRLVEHREDYRRLRAGSILKLRPGGYSLDDIWDGDGSNPNALLTVFRHDDNAAVVKGAVGDLPKTVFVLDYPLFERLVYNLVVNFDVFGNVGHQVLTRVYMDLIRMEAEELFLSFLPPADRTALRRDWYQGGLLTDLKLSLVFPLTNQDRPTAVAFHEKSARKRELVERAMFERLPAAVRGRADPLNWRLIRIPEGGGGAEPLTRAEQSLRRMASVYAKERTPFARYFPELALLLLERNGGDASLYSVVHNREHANVSWIMGENLRRVPYQDTLTVAKGVLGAYPNMIFVVGEGDAEAFSRMASRVASEADYRRLVDRFGVRRSSSRFWAVYDKVNAIAARTQAVERGTLDLTRYELDAR